jgi:hypothetical protein
MKPRVVTRPHTFRQPAPCTHVMMSSLRIDVLGAAG